MEEKHYREYAEKAIRVIRTTTERRNRRIKRKYFSQFYRICPRMDRYIIGKFIGTYFFAIALIISLAIVFDFNENLSKFTQYNAPWKAIVFDYYLNFIPYFANLFSPLFVFIAVIFFTSKMAGNSEIISILAAGVSFKRLMVPYMVSCVFISILSYTLAAYVIPHGTVIRQNFESMYKNNKKNTSAENVQLQVDRGVIAYMQHYDNVFKKGYGFCLDKFENKKLVSHMTASEIQYDTISDSKYHWKAMNWKIREMTGMREHITSGLTLDTLIQMEPVDLVFSKGQQETFTSPQLSEYINSHKLLAFFERISYATCSTDCSLYLKLFHLFANERNVHFNIVVFSIRVTAPYFFDEAFLFYNLTGIVEEQINNLEFFKA